VKKIISESGFARINRILQGDVDNILTYGIITGENPCGCELSPEENSIQDKKLRKFIKSKSYGYHKIGGNFFNNDENSYLIPNINKEDLLEVGVKLKQYSVIFGSKNVTGGGRVFMKHQMLRTYCNEPCKKSNRLGGMSLNGKLRQLTRLKKIPIGKIENERTVSLTGGDIGSRETDYSYVSNKDRKFSIPFYDDSMSSSYPSKTVGRNVVNQHNDITKKWDKELELDDKFAFMDLDDSEELNFENIMKSNKKIKITESQYKRLVKGVNNK